MSNTTALQGMLYRTLGSTGENVSAIGIGGWHIGLKGVDEQLSIRIIRTAVDRGINFMDNCWDYNEGASEIRPCAKAWDRGREKRMQGLMSEVCKRASDG
jgi:aryl-alcohol dehydrogenase-like predicted oxidoreductase